MAISISMAKPQWSRIFAKGSYHFLKCLFGFIKVLVAIILIPLRSFYLISNPE